MSKSLGRHVRLRVRGEYTAVQERGRRVSSRYLTLIGMPNQLDHDRLGIIASRKLGGAVIRNRAKRRLREIFRQSEPDTVPSGQPALDLVAIARRDLVSAPFADVNRDVQAAMARLRKARP